jgi:hypothetical protein
MLKKNFGNLDQISIWNFFPIFKILERNLKSHTKTNKIRKNNLEKKPG